MIARGCIDYPEEDVEFCQHRNMGYCKKHHMDCSAYIVEDVDEEDEED